MRKDFIPGLIFLIIFIPSAIIWIHMDGKRADRALEKIRTEYPSIGFDEEINEKVKYIVINPDPSIFRNNPHVVYITFNSNLKKRIYGRYNEYINEVRPTLEDKISVGDYFIKYSGKDWFEIVKYQNGDTLKYVFELRDDLGYPIKN